MRTHYAGFDFRAFKAFVKRQNKDEYIDNSQGWLYCAVGRFADSTIPNYDPDSMNMRIIMMEADFPEVVFDYLNDASRHITYGTLDAYLDNFDDKGNDVNED